MRRFGYAAQIQFKPTDPPFRYRVSFIKDGEPIDEPSGEIFMTRLMATRYAKRWLRRLNKGLRPTQTWEIQ